MNGVIDIERLDLLQRFARKVRFAAAHNCWEWQAATSSSGYGNIRHCGRTARAHRVAYELFVGPIPEGLVLDHLCRNPSCVNPAHLEAVPQLENVMRGEGFGARNARKTHCDKGHSLDRARVDDRGRRHCRECQRIRQSEFRKSRRNIA